MSTRVTAVESGRRRNRSAVHPSASRIEPDSWKLSPHWLGDIAKSVPSPDALAPPRVQIVHGAQQLGTWQVKHHLQLARVEPGAVALLADVDLHVLDVAHVERTVTARALELFVSRRARGALAIERRTLLLQPLRVASREILVLILTRFPRLPHAPSSISTRSKLHVHDRICDERIAWQDL